MLDAFEPLDSSPLLSLSFPSPSSNNLPSSSLCLATSQPFLRRFESRASQRNALMRTWLPSHFPLRSSAHPNRTAATAVAEAATPQTRPPFSFFPTPPPALSITLPPRDSALSPPIDMWLVKFARDTGYSWTDDPRESRFSFQRAPSSRRCDSAFPSRPAPRLFTVSRVPRGIVDARNFRKLEQTEIRVS